MNAFTFVDGLSRPRGGALTCPPAARGGLGLSPPTRGSLDLPAGGQRWLGSIPAHAGEP